MANFPGADQEVGAVDVGDKWLIMCHFDKQAQSKSAALTPRPVIQPW